MCHSTRERGERQEGGILLEHPVKDGEQGGKQTLLLCYQYEEKESPQGRFERTEKGLHRPQQSKKLPGKDEAPPGRVNAS